MMALISDSAAVGTLFEAKRMKLFMTQLPPSRGTTTARLVAALESELQLPANESWRCGRCCTHTWGRCGQALGKKEEEFTRHTQCRTHRSFNRFVVSLCKTRSEGSLGTRRSAKYSDSVVLETCLARGP